MSNSEKGRRWGRKSRRDLDASIQEAETNAQTTNYVPPSLSEGASAAPSSTSASSEAYFVTSPPRKAGLTGNISSLFRRANSKEPGDKRSSRRGRSASQGKRRNTANANANGSSKEQHNPKDLYYQDDEEQVDDGVLTARRHHQQQHHHHHQQTNNSQEPRHSSSSSPRFQSNSAAAATNTKAAAASSNSRSSTTRRNHNNHNHKIESPMAMAAADGGGNRLFYSSQNDDDSQDSFESKMSRFSRASASASAYSKGDDDDDDDDDSETQATNEDDETTQQTETKTILRYRGFSTSLKSLFLDEALVCASMGCFGLILSNRTEFLLQIRNDRRGVKWGRSTSRRALPSRIVAYALFLTLVMIAMTFVIWGFGTNNNKNNYADGFYEGGYDYEVTDNDQAETQYQVDDDAYNNGNNGNYNGNGNYYNNDDGAAAQNDDGANQNYNYNNDDANANANNDDANANANNDDANANANNDDANANNDDANANGDDANANNGDDANANNDDANANNDDANANNGDDANANNGDDANANNGDDYYNRRMGGEKDTTTTTTISTQQWCPHRINGIFKIRDMNEGLWIPAVNFLKEEWHSSSQDHDDDRRNLKDYNTYHGSSSSSSSSLSTFTRTRTTPQERYLANGSGSGSGSASSTTTTTSQDKKRDLAADLRHSFILVFLVVLGILGRRRRMRTRYYLVRARAQEDHLFYASSGVGVKRVAFQDSREDQYEGACSHTLCGCYPTDPPKEGDEIDDAVEVSDDGVTQRKTKRHHEDCISRGFDCLMSVCCGALCKCWCQCLSISALAQEAREIRLLLPTRFQRIDFITHQPFYEYQKHLNDLRRGWLGKTRGKSGIVPHFNALSRLSRYILGGFFITFVVILATLLLNPRASFSWPDAVVLIATFLQSFFVIFLVHWLFHKSDLSLDAVIKFFAAGFLIAVPSAFFFEGLLVNITLCTAWLGYWLARGIGGDFFVDWVYSHYRLIWIVGELVNAYVVAAVTEELCKYYTFRCVEHPDLIFLTGLDRKSQDDRDIQGGLVKYPFGSHQVQQSNKDFADDMSVGNMSRASHRSVKKEEDTLHPSTTDDEFYEDEHDVRTHLQKAAAVTTGMICVAVGLACAENFIYVFLLGGASSDGSPGGIMEEWIVLLFRSIFPVHALAAAMQSVNMIRKFVECDDDNSHRVGVGRIILPAVIMHGSFDAVLLGINVFIETAWDTYYVEANDDQIDDTSNPPYNPIIVNIVAWTSIICVMLSGLLWYYRENRNQRLRLILLEQKEKAMETDSAPYTSPSELGSPRQTTSELELV